VLAPNSDPVLVASDAVIRACAAADSPPTRSVTFSQGPRSSSTASTGVRRGEPSGNDAPTGGCSAPERAGPTGAPSPCSRPTRAAPWSARGTTPRPLSGCASRVAGCRAMRGIGHRKATIGERKERCVVVARAGADTVSRAPVEADPASYPPERAVAVPARGPGGPGVFPNGRRPGSSLCGVSTRGSPQKPRPSCPTSLHCDLPGARMCDEDSAWSGSSPRWGLRGQRPKAKVIWSLSRPIAGRNGAGTAGTSRRPVSILTSTAHS
jgi:hypothetical protein